MSEKLVNDMRPTTNISHLFIYVFDVVMPVVKQTVLFDEVCCTQTTWAVKGGGGYCKTTSNHNGGGERAGPTKKHVFFGCFWAETVVKAGTYETESLSAHFFPVLAAPSPRSQSPFLSQSAILMLTVIDTD